MVSPRLFKMPSQDVYRIYVEDLIPRNIDTTLLITRETHRRQYSNFFSDKGLFRIMNGILHRVDIDDGVLTRHQLTNDKTDIVLFTDTSKMTPNHKRSQLPIGHTIQKIEEVSYRLLQHAETRLVVELEGKCPVDVYFETTIPIFTPEVTETILTFLSELKFCS